MKVIGVTGSVGCGKSAVLHVLKEQYHALIIETDEVARKLEEKGQQVFARIVEAFGETVVGPDGQLDRNALAEIVFHEETKLKFLNSIVHPAVKRQVEACISEARNRNVSLVVVESAILVETGFGELCDEIWTVYAKDSVRRKRLRESRGYDDEKTDAILSRQKDLAYYSAFSRVVIDNSGPMEETRKIIAVEAERLLGQA